MLLSACTARFNRALNTRCVLIWAALALPVFFGLVSLMLGQDSNWDLFNYHLYNPFAWLHRKLDTDLAVASMQTYFNPLLDVPYYLLNRYLPAPLVGFLMGLIQGLNFTLVLGIAYLALPDLPSEDRYRIPLLLALAGCLTANFLSEIGSSMGDNATALFVLAALFIILLNWQNLSKATLLKKPLDGGRPAASAGRVHLMPVSVCQTLGVSQRSPSKSLPIGLTTLAAGVLAGLGAGLKLTNAVYLVALCAAWFAVPLPGSKRFRLAFLFGVGAVIGVAITGGFWFYEMGQRFGNPFFPQFSMFFPHPLTQSVGVIDSGWRPKGLLETVLWPFLSALDSHRVGQLRLHQIIWPMLYISLAAWGWIAIRQACRKRALRNASSAVLGRLEPQARYILACIVIGYLTWMMLFSVARYLVPIELLAPLAVWLLLTSSIEYKRARRIAGWTLLLSTLIVLAGGVSTWGHEPWATRAFRVEMPRMLKSTESTKLDELNKAAILMLTDDTPYAWLAPFFPATTAFAGIGSSFLQTPAYIDKVQTLVARRADNSYAIVAARRNWRSENVAKINAIVDRLGLTKSARGCAILDSVITRFHLHARLHELKPTAVGLRCTLGLSQNDEQDIPAENRAALAKATQTLARYGFILDTNRCALYRAFVGQSARPYQFCPIHLSALSN